MAEEKAQATFARRFRVLEAVGRLSHLGRWVLQSEIVSDLRSQGYPVAKHNVRRDLLALAEVLPQLECNDNSRGELPQSGVAYGYRWTGKNAGAETGLSIAEALSLVMVERYLRQALPATLTHALQGVFRKAANTLDLQKRSPEAKWAAKISVVPPTQPLLPPKLAEPVVDVVHEALLREKQIRVRYRNSAGKEEDLVLHGLGLIQRGPATYLIALCFAYDDPRAYPLHRILSAQPLDDDARKPDGFSIADYAEAQGHFGTGRPITLKARVSRPLASILEETKLDAKQVLSAPDANGWRTLTARVRDTWQLRWWILSEGARIEITGPRWLRDNIIGKLHEAASLYCGAREGERCRRDELVD